MAVLRSQATAKEKPQGYADSALSYRCGSLRLRRRSKDRRHVEERLERAVREQRNRRAKQYRGNDQRDHAGRKPHAGTIWRKQL